MGVWITESTCSEDLYNLFISEGEEINEIIIQSEYLFSNREIKGTLLSASEVIIHEFRSGSSEYTGTMEFTDEKILLTLNEFSLTGTSVCRYELCK